MSNPPPTTPKQMRARLQSRWVVVVAAIVAILASAVVIVRELLPQRPLARPSVIPPPPPNPRTVADQAIDDEQDRLLQQAMQSKERWTPLPSFIQSVERDGSGRVWFVVRHPANADPPNYSADDLRRSVERAARGETSIIRGGKILLVDSAGRFLARTSDSRIDCYDGTRWLEPYDLSHVAIPPSTSPTAHSNPLRKFCKRAFEDSAGNVYVVSYGFPEGGGLHKRTPDGTWTFHPYPTNDPLLDQRRDLHEDPQIVEQTAGRIALYPPWRGEVAKYDPKLYAENVRRQEANEQLLPREHLYRVMIFDNATSSWTIFKPEDHPPPAGQWGGDWVEGVIPMPDGSVATFYKHTTHFAVHWPAASSARFDKEVLAVVEQLDDGDALVRAAASERLLKLGPAARDRIEAMLAGGQETPQRRAALQRALAKFAEMAKAGGTKPQEIVWGGRYSLSEVSFVSRAAGRVRLFVGHCFDHRAQAQLGPCLITIDRDSTWTATPISEYVTRWPWLPSALRNAYEDLNGRLWVGTWNDFVIEPDFTMHPAGRPGFHPGSVRASDREGRVFFVRETEPGAPWRMFDARHPEREPDLPMQLVSASRLCARFGADTGWAANVEALQIQPNGTTRAIELPAGDPDLGADNEEPELSVVNLVPMTTGAAIAFIVPRGQPANYGLKTALWDGREWHMTGGEMRMLGEGSSLRSFIHANAKLMVELAPRDVLAGLRPNVNLWRFGSDRGRGLWLKDIENVWVGDMATGHSETHEILEYFDGSAWHDVWPLFKADAVITAELTEEVIKENKLSGTTNRVPPFGLEFSVLGTIGGGRWLVMAPNRAGDRKLRDLIGVSSQDGALRRTTLVDLSKLTTAGYRVVPSTDGHLWVLVSEGARGTLYELDGSTDAKADAIATTHEYSGDPVLVDSSRRVWCFGQDEVIVVSGSHRASVPMSNLSPSHTSSRARLAQAPDGRMWLLHPSGLSELRVSDSSDQMMRLEEAGRWKWNAPANTFDTIFFDAAGGLWLDGEGGKIGRISLPPPASSAATSQPSTRASIGP